MRRAAVGRSARHKATRKIKEAVAGTNQAIAEILQFGYEVFSDTVEDYNQSQQTNGAARLTRLRRNRGTLPRYTPEMELKKFIKEARKTDFNIFNNEIITNDLNFDL